MISTQFRLDRDELEALALANADDFAAAQPFPHVVVDDFLPVEVLDELFDTYPRPDDGIWRRYDAPREVKLALEDETRIPPAHLAMLRELNSQTFVGFLERLTGISGLIPDPHFRGGGLHQTTSGGLLKVHADFDMHPRLHLRRRLNVILYLNKDWQDAFGGALELWDKNMTHAVRKISPVGNRLMIFATTDHNNHGHPDPLPCPEDVTRKSLAAYYYTVPGPGSSSAGHSSLFRERPGERFLDRGERWAMRAGMGGAAVRDAARRIAGRPAPR